MSTTLSMWLGLAFWALGAAAVLLQAWLWGPQFWDDAAKKTRAPRHWLRAHAFCGYAFTAIYVAMMFVMVPRLWQYQGELPARTVVHATAAIIIGVLLTTKLAILRFFRHFEEAMPRIGFSIFLAASVLGALSLPFAVRAHDLLGAASHPTNLSRVRRGLTDISSIPPAQVELGASPAGLGQGRELLVSQCTYCHDLRTILSKPRTAGGWHDVVVRMQDRAFTSEARIRDQDVPLVTAYLIAITPEIQAATARKRALEENVRARVEREAIAPTVPSSPLKDEDGNQLLEQKCTGCHELTELDKHGGDGARGWGEVLRQMIAEGAELEPGQLELLAEYLARKRPPRR